MTTGFKLFRNDGTLYLHRRGFECRWFGVYLHHIGAPDPSRFLHDHPWSFKSLVLRGEYVELIASTRHSWAKERRHRRRFSLQGLRLDQCHTITDAARSTWTLVFRGPRVRDWGFYDDNGYWTYWEDMPRTERDLSFVVKS